MRHVLFSLTSTSQGLQRKRRVGALQHRFAFSRQPDLEVHTAASSSTNEERAAVRHSQDCVRGWANARGRCVGAQITLHAFANLVFYWENLGFLVAPRESGR